MQNIKKNQNGKDRKATGPINKKEYDLVALTH